MSVASENRKFEKQLQKFLKKDVKEGGTKNIRKVALTALKLVVTKSPVDEGTFKGNWNVGINNVNLSVDPDRREPQAISEGLSVIGSFKTTLGSSINISNNLPYANRIEYDGWSDQAPIGVVRVSKIELERKLSSIIGGK